MLALLGSGVILAQQEQAPKNKKLTAEEVSELLEKKEVFFLDVREPKELEEHGTLKGYVNIPIGQLESRLNEIPKDKLIVTACQRGARAARAAELLERKGYKVAGSCGLVEWKQKGKPVIYPKKA